jgi:hypothetical protein
MPATQDLEIGFADSIASSQCSDEELVAQLLVPDSFLAFDSVDPPGVNSDDVDNLLAGQDEFGEIVDQFDQEDEGEVVEIHELSVAAGVVEQDSPAPRGGSRVESPGPNVILPPFNPQPSPSLVIFK